MNTNKHRLVMQSVQGKIHSPSAPYPYRINRDGIAQVLPATGGITVIMSSKTSKIQGVLSKEANIANYLNIK